ncbi:uncharacterized protein LOC112082990 [Eutrema salsugineum]|uniref:uncharacterized protein LOC112082990 n=1 Tax=Eutrema salsugineum TaxID=72664 RepID=UPI000CED5625|nr:uncharacterized protein LOC112082990 [Eutrema salsugineum]
MVSKECSAVLQNKVLNKRSDPGRFILSVKIGNMIFARSLCDLGSSVNLMPYYVEKRLGYTRFKPTKTSLMFADRSTKFPVGMLEDLHVHIGDTLIPEDFVVLELDEEPKDPLILGRSFLCTPGGIIDVKGGVVGDMMVRFEMNKLMKKPILDGHTFIIDREQSQQAIGDKDNLHSFFQNRAVIAPPAIQRKDFEIKPQLISLVKQHLFHGLPSYAQLV